MASMGGMGNDQINSNMTQQQMMEAAGNDMDERGQPIGANSIEQAMMAGFEKEFDPRGDIPAIQEILDVKDVINYVQELKQIFSQTSMPEAIKQLVAITADQKNGETLDKATVAKLESDIAVKLMRLICQGRIGSPHSVMIDERSSTLIFEDDEL